jgi:hypothetical protein
MGDVHWAGQREVLAHEQGTDPLWVPPDEIPSHADVAALVASHCLGDLGASPADVSTAGVHSTADITLRSYGTRGAGALDRLGALG